MSLPGEDLLPTIARDRGEFLMILGSAVGCDKVFHNLKIFAKNSLLFKRLISHIDMAIAMYKVSSLNSSIR